MGAPGLQDCLEILYGRASGVTKADVKLKGLQGDLVLGWSKLRKDRRKQMFEEERQWQEMFR